MIWKKYGRNQCKLVVISKIWLFFFINRDFGSLTNQPPRPCILLLLRRIKNPIHFNILTRSNYMFNHWVIQFVVFFVRSTKIHYLVPLIMLSPCIFFEFQNNVINAQWDCLKKNEECEVQTWSNILTMIREWLIILNSKVKFLIEFVLLRMN
jgi:hypothetical protein